MYVYTSTYELVNVWQIYCAQRNYEHFIRLGLILILFYPPYTYCAHTYTVYTYIHIYVRKCNSRSGICVFFCNSQLYRYRLFVGRWKSVTCGHLFIITNLCMPLFVVYFPCYFHTSILQVTYVHMCEYPGGMQFANKHKCMYHSYIHTYPCMYVCI